MTIGRLLVLAIAYGWALSAAAEVTAPSRRAIVGLLDSDPESDTHVRRAARELRRHLRALTNARALPLTVDVDVDAAADSYPRFVIAGPVAAAAMGLHVQSGGQDGHAIIKHSSGDLVLFGSTARAALHAVHTFSELLGVRFYPSHTTYSRRNGSVPSWEDIDRLIAKMPQRAEFTTDMSIRGIVPFHDFEGTCSCVSLSLSVSVSLCLCLSLCLSLWLYLCLCHCLCL